MNDTNAPVIPSSTEERKEGKKEKEKKKRRKGKKITAALTQYAGRRGPAPAVSSYSVPCCVTLLEAAAGTEGHHPPLWGVVQGRSVGAQWWRREQ